MTEKKPVIPAPPSPIDPQLVETLGEIANRLDLSEIEVAQGELKIKVKRQSANAAAAPIAVAVPALSTIQAHALAPAANEAALAIAANAVKSPMVGTAYLRPSPESAPFITIGMQVKAGEKLLLIEAMKTFNEIVAPQGGTVTSILVEDGQPVEFGQPLVVVE
ncbi:MAG: acetyl-CoA carboxylase biotin carboxyl carrier protein [Methylovirgula sp.]|uniref:acetyl-CoA carboxylase biotin carboxyl carrier protein n=1 Tax=Methylovirgula sp. TaxID=1978224 RepID=UPI00307649ED